MHGRHNGGLASLVREGKMRLHLSLSAALGLEASAFQRG